MHFMTPRPGPSPASRPVPLHPHGLYPPLLPVCLVHLELLRWGVGGWVLQGQLGARAEPGEVGGKLLVGLSLLSGAGLLRPGCDRI